MLVRQGYSLLAGASVEDFEEVGVFFSSLLSRGTALEVHLVENPFRAWVAEAVRVFVGFGSTGHFEGVSLTWGSLGLRSFWGSGWRVFHGRQAVSTASRSMRKFQRVCT
jgi:hypothetical protein